MADFSAFKKAQRTGGFAKLKDKVDKDAKGKSYDDDRYWKPTIDKSGNGYAVIRFLPGTSDESIPYVRIYDHGFKENGKWYIDKCPTTIGVDCWVCNQNRNLWNAGDEASTKIARNRGRRESYHSNILVISDPANPDNEGKVFLFRYGKKIFKKIMERIAPEFADETPMNPFDFWEGANFKLKIKNEGGYRNYDSSEFAAPSALMDGDDSLLEKVWKAEYVLEELADPKLFPSYEDTMKKFNSVVNGDSIERDESGDIKFESPASRFSRSAEERVETKTSDPWDDKEDFEPPKKSSATKIDEDNDDDMSIYAKLLD